MRSSPLSAAARLAAALLAALAFAGTSCATDPAVEPSRPTDPASQRPTPSESAGRIVAARRRLESHPTDDDCRRPDEGVATGWADWIDAWCHLRRGEWPAVDRAARRALPHFESTGAVRRQIELHLMVALAEAERDEAFVPSSTHPGRALRLLRLGGVSLHGDPGDPFGGDLPYLLARARATGLTGALPVGPDDVTASRDLLLRIARWNYRTGGLPRLAVAVELTRARQLLETGEVGAALDRLDGALTRGLEADNRAQIQRGLATFARLAGELGLEEAAESVAPFSGSDTPAGSADGPALTLDDLREAPAEDLGGWLPTPAHRRALADAIDELRADPDLAARPPVSLVRGLRRLDPAEHLKAGSWRLAHQSGLLLAEQGYRQASRRYLEHAVVSLETVRARIPAPELRQSFFADKRPVFRALVDSYVGIDTRNLAQTDYRRALRVANRVKARGLIDLLTGDIRPEQTVERRGAAWSRPDDLRGAARQVLDHLEGWRGPKSDGARPRFAGHLPDSLLDRIPEDTALLDYMLGPNQSYVWVLTHQGLQMRRLTGSRTLEPLVDRFMETLVEPQPTDAQFREHRRLGERLYVELMGPVEDIVIDRDHLVVAADQSLYELPFEALIRPDRQRRVDYVAREHVVSYTPSSAALDLLERRTRSTAKPRSGALVFGAPDLDRPAIDLLALADHVPRTGMFSMEKMFPALPGGRAELKSIERQLTGRADLAPVGRTGRQATEHFLRTADLTSYRLIHLTTHGVSDARPLKGSPVGALDMRQPALLLTEHPSEPEDGVLTLGEILGYRTEAELVVLSGCTTGRGWRALGDGAYGLAGAFVYAGARHVIGSTWAVADRNTSELMGHIYRAIRAGAAPAEALNAGQRAMLAQRQNGHVLPPYFWAGFRSVGGLPADGRQPPE